MKYLRFDIRALSLMRMGVALTVMLDLLIRVYDLEAFYANSGATPLAMIYEYAWNEHYLSFHTMSGLPQVQLLLFGGAFFSACMLFIGYRTRLFTFLSWLFMLSLHNRNVLILQGGDDLLRMTLFWGMFLPWGARYSCDALLYKNTVPVTIKTLGTLAYLLQICYVYTGSALLKGPEWHTDYTALYYVYSLDQISYSVTGFLYGYPELLGSLTRLAYYFELLVPLLFFAPFKHGWFRLAGVAMVFGFHLFNGATIYIGLFFVIGIVTVVGILPSVAMDGFDRLTGGIKKYVARSFLGWTRLLRRLIPPRAPRYITSAPKLWLLNGTLIFLMVYVLFWNLGNLDAWPYKMNRQLQAFAYKLRIDQNWGMFAPGVFKDDGWYVYEGTTTDGDTLNLLAPDRPFTCQKPESVVGMFKNDRWRKYGENMLMTYNAYMRGYLCNYKKRIWNDRHPDRHIDTLRIVYMIEFSEPGYCIPAPSREVLFECAD